MKKLFFIMMAVLACAFGVTAQTRTVKGIVLEAATDEPLIGATVMPIGGGQGVATDIDGKFTLTVPSNVTKARISYVGYNPATVDLKEDMKVYLTSSASNLDDVVVVAYGTQKKSSITGAISSVDAEQISKRPVSSATAALEGSTPGITVTASYGSPGEDPTILIRGIGTVNGTTTPLYVVDGVPFGGNISDINPEDIESMSVLKDAASAALYGNRASNGVILITTKRAQGEKLHMTFRMNQGWYQRAIPEYDRTNASQFMEVEYQNMANAFFTNNADKISRTDKKAAWDYVTSTKDGEGIFGERLYGNYFIEKDPAKMFDVNGNFLTPEFLPQVADDLDWFDQATQNGYRQEYVFQGSGSTNRSDYMFSVGYLDENGYMKDNGFSRLTGRGSININPVSWLRAGLNISAGHQKFNNMANGVGDGSTMINNPFYFCRYMAPIYPVHQHYLDDATYYDQYGNPFTVQRGQTVTEDGEIVYDNGYYTVYDENGASRNIYTRNQLQDRNVILESQVNTTKTVRNNMNSIAYVDFILPYGFTATLKGNINTRNSERTKYGSKLIGDSKARGGSLNKTIYNYKNWTMQQQLNWNKTYGVSNIQVLLGHENYVYQYDYTYIVKDNEAFANLPALSNFSVMNNILGYKNIYKTESYLGRVMFNYDDRYNVEASFRRDGTSRFHKDNRWGNFGSVGANWIFTKESFMERTASWLNFGKLRADWGQVANDAGADYYAYYALFDADQVASLPAYYLSQNAANDLKWETGESWGVALEARMFDRWNLTVEYFDKRNKDLIFNVYAPVSSGPTSTTSATSTTTQNLGTISNHGIEIDTDIDIFRNRDWTINVGANLTWIKNKIVKLPAQNRKISTYAADRSLQPPAGILDGSRFITEGRSRYEWYTYHWAGVDMTDGQSLYDADLVNYHIGSGADQIGGSYQCNEQGLPVDEDGKVTYDVEKMIPTSTELTDYRLINGKYYVTNTTYAAKNFRGSSLPNVYGSFQANIKFRDFTLGAMFSYSLGGKIMDGVYSSLMGVGQTPANYHVDVLNCWTDPVETSEANRINPNINPEINYLNNTYNNATSDRWLVSRDYLCFKNLNITYSLPKKITRVAGLSGVQISFSAENLHIWGSRKGMNPMMGIAGGQSNYLVPARVYTFGLSVNI